MAAHRVAALYRARSRRSSRSISAGVTESYAATNPPDAVGQVHVGMVRLQVLAHKLG